MTVINTAPTLITERLRLDAHMLDDFDSLAALWADPQVVRYIGGTPRDREDSWGRLMRYVGHWALLGYGYWAVRDKQSGEYLGSIGFSNFLRDITPALDAPEMGWTLVSSAHGKGYATEALRAALAWGKTHLPGRKPSASSRRKTRPRWRWRKSRLLRKPPQRVPPEPDRRDALPALRLSHVASPTPSERSCPAVHRRAADPRRYRPATPSPRRSAAEYRYRPARCA